jgi:hypothetical protein
MTHPKKKKSFRTIDVEGQKFRWHFRPSFDNSYLTLQSTVSSGEQLIIILLGWKDPWLAINDFHITDGGNVLDLYTAAQNEPEIITNKFVRTVILHGLANDWKPNDRHPPLYCVYSQGIFSSLTPQLETLVAHF